MAYKGSLSLLFYFEALRGHNYDSKNRVYCPAARGTTQQSLSYPFENSPNYRIRVTLTASSFL